MTASEREPRIAFLRPVLVREKGSTRPPRRLFSANLSRSGLFVRTPAPLPPGTRVEVALEARGRVLPFCEGEVVWKREGRGVSARIPGFGLRILAFAKGGQPLVEHLLSLGPATSGTPSSARQRLTGEGAPATPRRWWLAAAAAALLGLGGAAGWAYDQLQQPEDAPGAVTARS